jgi:hypothetical protein
MWVTGLLSRGNRKVHPMKWLMSQLWQGLVRKEWIVVITVISAKKYRALLVVAFFVARPQNCLNIISLSFKNSTSVLPKQGSPEHRG